VVVESVLLVAQQGAGPVGSEFGKAPPSCVFVAGPPPAGVFFRGGASPRRYSRMNRRRLFAETHGIDPFDAEKLDAAMAEAGVLDQRKLGWF